jgi:isopenicillin N synthase-like dioxygenase
LIPAHREPRVNFCICDYNPQKASPENDKGCGAHTDYGAFSMIFYGGTGGLEVEDPNSDDTWIPIPGEATVVLAA